MPPNIFLIIILAILVADFALFLLVEILNLRNIRPDIPKEMQGFYKPELYRKSQDYLKVNTQFDLIRSCVMFVVVLFFLLSGGFNSLDLWVRELSQLWVQSAPYSSVQCGLIYIGVLIVGLRLINLPFNIYHTFVIEERFGFNKTSASTYVLDLIKSLILMVILGGGALALVLWFFEEFESYAWLVSWLALVFFQVVLVYIAPVWILPLFNRFSPLEDGELKEKINQFANQEGFKIQGIYTMDGSKRSTKANAYFTGFGQFRRIVLFDTLIEKHSVSELLGVLAHEIGHYKLRHIGRNFAFSVISSGIMFFLISVMINHRGLLSAFQIEQVSIYASLVCIGFLYSPLSKLFGIIGNNISRRYEFEADSYAAKRMDREPLIEALKKLSVDNLSNLFPHHVKVFLEYTHPPLLQRIQALRSVR